MTDTTSGTVISMHAFGATVRLEGGELASAPATDVQRNRAAYERAYVTKKAARFVARSRDRHLIAVLAPELHDVDFEAQIASYLKQTAEWEPADAPAHERHFLRKKRRAALFESKHSNER